MELIWGWKNDSVVRIQCIGACNLNKHTFMPLVRANFDTKEVASCRVPGVLSAGRSSGAWFNAHTLLGCTAA